VSPGARVIDGDTFQPWPSSRAAGAPVPSVAMPPAPFAPVKFSGLTDRVTPSASCHNSPMRAPRVRR